MVHPSFTASNIGEEIEGMWVGKFESSNASSPYNNEGITANSSKNLLYGKGNGTSTDVTIRPNVTAWRWTDVVTMYDVCQAMNDDRNIHGLTNATDTMMMKNSQWGAVAYLAQSNYGNKQIASDNTSGIWTNPYNEGYVYENLNGVYGAENYSTTLTGMVGESRDIETSNYAKVQESGKQDKGASVTVKYNYINKVADGGGLNGTLGEEFTRTYYRYNTEQGVKGSTTRNIYGIYDISGGAWEYMSSFLTNYEANQNKYGDAVWETSIKGEAGQYSWNDDNSNFPYLSSSFFARGASYDYHSTAGVFYFNNTYGGSLNSYGFRTVAI